MKNAALSLCLASISVFACGCGASPWAGNKELSRSQALKLIRRADAVKQHVSITVVTGQYVQSYDDEKAKYDALQSAGFIEIMENPPVQSAFDVTKLVPAAKGVHLTAKGEKAVTGRTKSWRFEDCQFVTAEGIEIVEVTGITKDSETEADAEFTLRWIPNEIGKAFFRANLDVEGRPVSSLGNQLNSSGASFRLFDDGWRIQQISLP